MAAAAVVMFQVILSLSVLQLTCAFTHNVILNPDNRVRLSWKFDNEKFTFQVEADTLGYVGLGFNTQGSMAGADIVVGWVSDGKAYLQDYYALSNTRPSLDASQDYHLISGSENDTHTTLTFWRKAETGDCDQDMILGDDTMRVITAIHEEDPVDGNMKYHVIRPGVKSLYLRDPHVIKEEPRHTIHWEIRAEHEKLQKNLTTYYLCRVYQFPFQSTHYLTGYRPIIQEGHESLLHHIIIYKCHHDDLDGTYYHHATQKTSSICYSPNMPTEFNKCRSVTVAWAIGSEGETYPTDVALPVYEGDYFLAEIHYDKPNNVKDDTDDSGIRFYLTTNPPKHLAGSLRIGLEVSKFQVIPPRQEEWLTVGLCPDVCTKNALNNTINIFQVLLHGHLAMEQARLRHIRDGKELPAVAVDNFYDFNYQQARILKDPVQVEPGDSFIMECRYSSRDKDTYILGGLDTNQEMCLAYALYYPLSNLAECVTKPDYVKRCEFIEAHQKSSVVSDNMISPYPFTTGAIYNSYCGNQEEYNKKIINMNWSEKNLRKFQKMETKGQFEDCTLNGKIKISGIPKYVDYPQYKALEAEQDECESSGAREPAKREVLLCVILSNLLLYLCY